MEKKQTNMNIKKAKKFLQEFQFNDLFVEELGWNNPPNTKKTALATEGCFKQPIAELAGATVFEVTTAQGTIPDAKMRKQVSEEIQQTNFEHILIFTDQERQHTLWRWLKKQDKKMLPREHEYHKGQTGDLFIAKIAGLFTDVSEIEQALSIVDVAQKLKNSLDIEKVTKKFFKDYQERFEAFKEFIQGIEDEKDRKWYASVVLNRLMFIYFLQKKGFLDKGNFDYLKSKLAYTQQTFGQDKFYSFFLHRLFFEGFAKSEQERSAETNQLIGKIKYLNGGLFLPHKIEIKYQDQIRIKDEAFSKVFELFDKYSWSLNDTIGGNDNEINPDVLGHIFEKYINQKAFGAYYTRTEITEYLCRQTVEKIILDYVNEDVPLEHLPEKTKQKLQAGKHFESLDEMLRNLDRQTCHKLLTAPKAILPTLSLLDPACGSGAFLVAAMKVLIDVYAPIVGKIDFLGDADLKKWKQNIEQAHPSLAYYIKKQIITNNLYGVDIMEEATEIAKLRLFLALVSSTNSVDELEPLPNIDFNIMAGNSLIGLMRVDDKRFEYGKQLSLTSQNQKSYRELVAEKERLINQYKHPDNASALPALKQSIDQQRTEAIDTLNDMLRQDFSDLKINYEAQTWDSAKNKEGKPQKRAITKQDIEALEPFHWAYEFSDIFRNKNGFDAIITNPPWEIFKPNDKEFLMDFSDSITRKKMNIKDFEQEKNTLLKDKEIEKAYLAYLSRFPHLSLYFRSAKQYENQISVVNGKKAGTDINLYKLFTEQSYNLLKPNGYCGIVIPSGIYTDLGTKQLRQMLFEKCRLQEIVSFANEKFIFENVHHAFKFCFLSFEKAGKTESFTATFRINPRECIKADELDAFLYNKENFVKIPTSFIYKQSPDSLSIMEIKQPIEFDIIHKMLKFPMLGDKVPNTWEFALTREFDMTNDSHLFRAKPDKNTLPLYEGKMVHQFSHQFAEGKYWVNEAEGRQAVLGRQADTGQILDYQRYRIAHRAIARNTDSRTMIAGILPKNVFFGHSLNATKNEIKNADLLYILSILNSICLDYFLRQSVSANLTMFFIYQLPVPRLTASDKWYADIVWRSAMLVCSTEEYRELWKEVKERMSEGVNERMGKDLPTLSELERGQVRAELDAIVAHVYGLSEAELAYILSTFPLVKEAQKVAVQNAYRDIERGVLEAVR